MMHRWRSWLRLPGRERVLTVLLASLLPLIALSLRAAGFNRTLRWLERLSTPPVLRSATEAELVAAERLAQLTSIVGRHGVFTATCLRQSLLVHALLRQRGLESRLKIGVRKQGCAFDAHAWVEINARPLAQPTLVHIALGEHANEAIPR